MKKLTIAIPIYNGGKTIKRLLDCLFSQNFSTDDVDIIICDNGSTDNTLEVIQPYLNKFTLYKNETNLGADKNFELCVARSNSEYVWILGDDDYLKDNTVNIILDKINAKNYACIFINFSLYDIKVRKEVLAKFVNINEDIVAKGISQFLEHTNIAANFLSSIIHNKSAFESIDTSKYYNTHFLQFAVILDYVNDRDVLIIADPLVINMGDSSDRDVNIGGGAVKTYNNLYTIIKNSETKFLKESERKKIGALMQKMLKYRILAAKRLDLKVDKKFLKQLVNNFKSYPAFWIIDMPLLATPKFLINLIYKIYRVPFINSIFVKYIYTSK